MVVYQSTKLVERWSGKAKQSPIPIVFFNFSLFLQRREMTKGSDSSSLVRLNIGQFSLSLSLSLSLSDRFPSIINENLNSIPSLFGC